MADINEISLIEAEDADGFKAKASHILDRLKAIDPANLHCLMVCAVTKDDGKVMVSALGSDTDLAKMMMTLSEVTSQGVVQSHMPSNPNKETAH